MDSWKTFETPCNHRDPYLSAENFIETPYLASREFDTKFKLSFKHMIDIPSSQPPLQELFDRLHVVPN